VARVVLDLDEVKEGQLPAVCMKCGAPAEAQPRKLFSWHPGWVILLILVGLLVYVIVALILTKRRRVWTPLCRRHAGYWTVRAWYVLGGFCAILAAFIAWLVIGAGTDAELWWPVAGLTLAGVFFVWLVSAGVLQTISIRPERITNTKIGLLGVHTDFKAALERQRDDQWEEDRRRWDRGRPSPYPQRGEIE
jgi:hypothetical protein